MKTDLSRISPQVDRCRLSTLALLLCTWAAGAAAQEPQQIEPEPAAQFSEAVRVRVINVDVVVTGRDGRSVGGLSSEAFELRLDGDVVPISYFYSESAEEAAPKSGAPTSRPEAPNDSSFRSREAVEGETSRRSHVVVLVDHTRLRPANRKRAFRALEEAIERVPEESLIAVVGIEGSLVFHTDFLYDRRAISKVLDDLSRIALQTDVTEIDRRQIFGELTRGQSGGILGRTSLADEDQIMSRIQAYAADEYDRSLRSLRQIETVVATLAGLSGRRLLLYLGEGIPTRPGEGLFIEWRNRFGGGSPNAEIGIRRFDFNTDYTREVGNYDLERQVQELAKAANRAGVTLYAVDAEGNHGGDLRSALTEQGSTSESVSYVDENYRAPLESATQATGGALLRSSGKLADQLVGLVNTLRTYYSLGFVPPADWQPGSDHKLEVKVKRRGLRVQHREEVRLPEIDEQEASATVAALLYRMTENPLEIRAVPAEESSRREDGNFVLPIQLELPIRNLGFLPQQGTQAASVTIYVAIRDAEGNPGKVQRIPFHLNIPDAKMEEAIKDSAHYPLPLVLRPGDRQLAIGVRDNVGGQLSTLRLEIAEFSTP